MKTVTISYPDHIFPIRRFVMLKFEEYAADILQLKINDKCLTELLAAIERRCSDVTIKIEEQ